VRKGGEREKKGGRNNIYEKGEKVHVNFIPLSTKIPKERAYWPPIKPNCKSGIKTIY